MFRKIISGISLLRVLVIVGCIALLSVTAAAHPMPTSVLIMDVKANSITAELQLPLSELQLALGKKLPDSAMLLQASGQELKAYILAHIRAVSGDGLKWAIEIKDMRVGKTEQTATGPYQELDVELLLLPPAGMPARRFDLYYDVIIHQLVTHKALVSVRQDWDNGLVGEEANEIGVIGLDVQKNIIPPLHVDIVEGSVWRGFKSMVQLGIKHIADGTDHLLFLLVLLLPAPLLVRHRRWAGFGGTRYSLLRLLRITAAFTIGHSATLLAGALGWLRLPSQPVEIMIAVSILVTAIHAIRPLFPGRELYVAAGFGLVHGLAFASTIALLHLEPGRMALSILGFNIGIELMQLFVVALVVPWLIALSSSPVYKWIRVGGAIVAGIAAIAWITERSLGRPNTVATLVQQVAALGKWLILGLVIITILNEAWMKYTRKAGK